LWAAYDPRELATPEAFANNPTLVMDWYRWRRALITRSMPNAGHRALVELERRVSRFFLITQNVDGLHALAGAQNLIELHGSIGRLRCTRLGCSHATEIWPESGLAACPTCGALLRPDIVWFGESLPAAAIHKAAEVSQHCDVFFSIGTSGAVEPAASLPYLAVRAGAYVIEINPFPTPLSIHASAAFTHPAGEALPAIVQAVWDVTVG
jgi:NAD-dependent deacetylase